LEKGTISTQYTIIDQRKHNANIIKDFIMVRYINAFDAGWRIFSFDIT
jgi:hypothetical protein